MGYILSGYCCVNQTDVDDFIKANNLDIKKDDRIIEKHFCKQLTGRDYGFGEEDECNFSYYYNKKHAIHEFHVYYYCNCIRDHPLLNDRHPSQPKLPYILSMCLYCITEPKDAKEAARQFREWFPEDETLMYFADWLEQTAEYCYEYNLER